MFVAEDALASNTDPEQVADLVNAIRDAQDLVDVKVVAQERAREYFHLLEQDAMASQEARDGKLKGILDKQIADAKEQLATLKATFGSAEADKTAYDTELQRLKDAKAAVDADADATDGQKAAAGQAVSDHEATGAALQSAFDAAQGLRDTLEAEIASDAKAREDAAYALTK